MTKKRHTHKTEAKTSPIEQKKRQAQKRATHKRRARQSFNMTWIYIAVGFVIVIAAMVLLLRPDNSLADEIPVSQAYEKFQRGDFFLDVREQQEWDQGHIPNSTHITLDALQRRIGELPKDRDIVVVCASGHRSKTGVDVLKQAGFNRVTCMSGGILAWATAGYPLDNSKN